MSAISERRERERAHRHQLIITAARELAETEGWEAVTTRRLADRVEYSQPVLYSHFNGKDAIVSAVALDGFGELATHLRRARQAAPGPAHALRAVCRAYLDFATERPALYQAMFILPTELTFASAETPAPLRACFDEFVSCFPPANERRELFAEVLWGALHGIAVLSESGRIPPAGQEERIDLLVTRFADSPASPGTP
ncbi:TetR/AcrR family transcriptional regulator [Micromonospora sp. M51]|uniref:TetR/AcrR family transcriptional regulator n=1 Tax=Micromonospora TaxID=1873 RepID=UPI00055D3689|nr:MULTISPECIES: TetR/AcrR family transcriptional regulator [Micromonospora]MBQ1011885.1 TetR/AcrR family transcriptional regulator [Micromonospora sp. M51]MBQ1033327.1 TetR/AcrR family transcriptional regulator [Micromonospora sp. C97]